MMYFCLILRNMWIKMTSKQRNTLRKMYRQLLVEKVLQIWKIIQFSGNWMGVLPNTLNTHCTKNEIFH